VNRIVSKIDTVAFVSWPDKVRNSTVDPCSGSETRSAKEPYTVVVSIAVTEYVELMLILLSFW